MSWLNREPEDVEKHLEEVERKLYEEDNPIPESELPGMWEYSDFRGGIGDNPLPSEQSWNNPDDLEYGPFLSDIKQDISKMNLEELDSYLANVDHMFITSEQLYETVQAEILALKKRLDDLNFTRSEAYRVQDKAKQEKLNIASRREKLLQERMADELIAETARKVLEIVNDFAPWTKLHEYQKEDVISAIHSYLAGYQGFLNANDMGLGKTAEALVSLYILGILFKNEHGRKPNVLWLTKSSILKTGGTVREAARWNPEIKLIDIEGSMPKSVRDGKFQLINMLGFDVITNYETIRTTEAIANHQWDIVVMDEVHKLKGGANLSGPTAIWKAVKELTQNVRFTFMLSGTPMVNRAGEMWAYLHIFDPDRFPNLRAFENAFVQMQYVASEMKMKINADKILEGALKGRAIRRAVTDPEVKLELPGVTPKVEIDALTGEELYPRRVMLQMTEKQQEAYDQMRTQFYVWMDEQDDDEPLTATAVIAQLTRLRQINVWPVFDFKNKIMEDGVWTGEYTYHKLEIRESSKIDEAIDIIAKSDDQIVIFSTFNSPMYEIQRRMKEVGITCEVLAGETSKNMANMEVGFQQGDIQVLCLNSAMGEGLNLQHNPEMWPGGSHTVITLDRWWNDARNDQCVKRVDRQGQTTPVLVYDLWNENSVDTLIQAIIDDKNNEIEGVMEDKRLRPSDWKKYLKDKL